jgi:predicted dehydrogenase
VDIRIGFIGCGRVAENHFKAILKCDGAKLVAVSDIDENLASFRAKEWGVSFISPEEMCKNKEIDAVFVLTPFDSHFYYSAKLLQNGKHVLVEKPVSMDVSEIKEMEKIVAREGKICMPGHSYIYLPELERFRKVMHNGEIGKPIVMFSNEIYFMPENLIKKYHGPLQEVLCHHLYLLLAYIGMPMRVQAFTGCFRNDQIATGDEHLMVNIDFGTGALAHLYLSWAAEDETSDPWTFKIKILGTNGGLHFSRRDVVNNVQGGKPQLNYPLYDEMFEKEVDYFVHRCVENGEEPLSSLKDAADAINILNAIKASIADNEVKTIKW